MATTESMPRPSFLENRHSLHTKSIPIHPSASTHHLRAQTPTKMPEADPMDVSPTSSSMPPPATSSPPRERAADSKQTAADSENAGGQSTVGAAAAAQQPKVVQTAFIHKLYNMLEDQSIQHLISWSGTNDSFVMSPSQDFAKVLAQYFKHTNISSFVRQLNMYGFHKVSDVFHNGAPDSTLWEFKHGNGNFKRGDVLGLREIKRRASRHTLINRDTYPTAAPKSIAPAQPLTGPQEITGDSLEHRLNDLESHYFSMLNRLTRSEDSVVFLTNKCQVLADGLKKSHQWNHDLASYLAAVVPESDSQIHRDIGNMQREIARQAEHLRSVESPDPSPHEPRPTFAQHLHYSGSHLHEPGPPLSPRQMPAPESTSRRPSQPSIFESRAPPPSFRNPLGAHMSISPRRYGSIGSNTSYSPSSSRAPPPPPTQLPPPPQHPLATVSSPPGNLSRRHTSADIRVGSWAAHGPPTPGTAGSHYGGHASSGWPSSPARGSLAETSIRDQLAAYELPRGPSSQQQSQKTTPPPSAHHDQIAAIAGTGPDSAWAVPGSRFPGFSKGFGSSIESGAPSTRRSSMASNLHGLLNPTGDTVHEDPDSGDSGGGKRKRMV